jgi:hypothetical protein
LRQGDLLKNSANAATIETKGRRNSRPFYLGLSLARRFIPHSQNKVGGTVNVPEHRAIPFVVGRAMQKHVRRLSND